MHERKANGTIMMHTIHLDLSITKGDVILQKNPRKQRNIKDSVSLGEKLHCKDTQQKNQTQ